MTRETSNQKRESANPYFTTDNFELFVESVCLCSKCRELFDNCGFTYLDDLHSKIPAWICETDSEPTDERRVLSLNFELDVFEFYEGWGLFKESQIVKQDGQYELNYCLYENGSINYLLMKRLYQIAQKYHYSFSIDFSPGKMRFFPV